MLSLVSSEEKSTVGGTKYIEYYTFAAYIMSKKVTLVSMFWMYVQFYNMTVGKGLIIIRNQNCYIYFPYTFISFKMADNDEKKRKFIGRAHTWKKKLLTFDYLKNVKHISKRSFQHNVPT